MEKINKFMVENEVNIVSTLIELAKQGDYTRYTSTRIEDLLISIREITKGIIQFIEAKERNEILHVDECYEKNGAVAYGIKEARLHRSRGVTLAMFLGLTKYYRRSYISTVKNAALLDETEKEFILHKINLYFDYFEIGFCQQWANPTRDKRIIELQEINRLLTNEKNKFHTIFHSMAEPVIVVDADKRIREINSAAIKCFGLDYQTAIGKPCKEIIPCIHHLPECPLKKAMREAGKYENIEISIEVNNRNRTFLVSGSFLEDISGKFAGGVELFIDVTEAKENELKLLTARDNADLEAAKLRAMVSGMGEGVVFADANETITEVNNFFLDLFGFTRQEMTGKSIYNFHDNQLAEKVKPLIESFKTNSNSSYVTLSRSFRDMELIMRVQPIYSNTLYQGVLLNVIDVTELSRARIEAEQALKQAEAANRAKSDFLANMSHEIRTPMNGILGFAEILLNQKLSEEQIESVKAISLCGEHLLELINDVLDLSKIESGKMVLEETVFSVYDLLRDALTTVRQKARNKGLEIRVDFRIDTYTKLIGDPTRIRQIISNLLSNAVKFSNEGTIQITVSKRPEECARDTFPLQVEVADMGIGVSEEKRELIFESFTQADRSTARRFGGTGLGLTISRSLVELMGGEIWVRNNEPKGSIFSFCIPAKTPDKQLSEPVDSQSEAEMHGITILVVEDDWVGRQIIEIDYERLNSKYQSILDKSSVKPAMIVEEISHFIQDYAMAFSDFEAGNKKSGRIKSILVAEDNLMNQKIIETFLLSEGYQVTLVKDGSEVVQALENSSFHLILMDMQMPIMDGYETTARIKSDKRWWNIPIVALTAYAMKGDEEKCLKAGCDYYISKPVKKSNLIALVNKITSHSEAEASDERPYPVEIEHLIPFFVSNIKQEIDKSYEALQRKDFISLRRTGHGLKGSCGAYGFMELSELGAEIEKSALAEDEEALADRLGQVKKIIENIKFPS